MSTIPNKRKPLFLIRRGSVKVPVYERKQVKGGRVYLCYVVPDHSNGRRKFRNFADLNEAKAKALEIAEATHHGKADVLHWEDDLRVEIQLSLKAVKSTGMSLLPACQLLSQAVEILGGRRDELLAACQHYVQNRPDRPFTPKPAKEAVSEYSDKKKLKVSQRRWRSLSSFLGRFAIHFGEKPLHEIDPVELRDFMDSYNWAPKSSNDFLGGVSLLYQEAQFRNWVPKGCNPAKSIKREKVVGSTVHVFEPWEAKQILSRISADLVAMLALWFFGGIRKEEISRMNWQQINRGLETGWIYLEAIQTKTGVARSVPVLPNLRAWLVRHAKVSGSVLPVRWQRMNQLDELPSYVSRKTGIQWKNNAPRHSFGTYYLKMCKDPGEVVKAMGNSLVEFEKHYWCKARSITESAAQDWFGILPDGAEKIVDLPVGKCTPQGEEVLAACS